MIGSMLCMLFGCTAVTTGDVFYRIFNGSTDQYVDVASGNATELYKYINGSESTAFYVHGWMESCHNASAIEITSAILSNGGYNVGCVDWSKLAKENYISAATSAKDVAEIFANDIGEMCDMGFEPEDMNVLGFSLGAHIAGSTGNNLQTSDYPSLGQITALDPAKPLYDPVLCSGCRRLESSDADMVYVVHTSGGSYGILDPIGNCDFYPNGGTAIQRGCPVVPTTIDPTQFLPTYRCSHDRSWRYFGEAIRNPDSHIAVKCDSFGSFEADSCSGNEVVSIGLDMPKNCSGTYYYTTNSESPYGRGAEGTSPSAE